LSIQQQAAHFNSTSHTKLSPSGSESSNKSSTSSSAAQSLIEEASPRYNFRALLRKTGQDLTSGQTLSKKKEQPPETAQVDFRNVLRNRAKTHIDEQVKLIQRLVTSH
jgi:hypothetical protein